MGIKRTFIKNTSLNVASYIYLSVAAIISIPILIHALGVQAFGLYTIITSITPILSALDFGLGLAVIRYLALPNISDEKKAGVWQTSFYFFTFVGLALFFVVIAIFYLYVFKIPAINSILGSNKLPIMFVVALTMLVNHLNTHFLTLPQARHRFDIFSLNAFVSGTASTLVTAVVVLIKPDLLLVFITQLLGGSVTATILYFYAKGQFKELNFPKFSLASFREVIGFGLKSFAGKVASSLEANGLNLIIAAYVSLKAVTYFSIPQSLIIKAAGGISMLTLSLFPLSTSLLTKESFPKLKKLMLWLQGAVVIGTFFGVAAIFFVGRPLLTLWLGNPDLVSNVYPLLQILSVQLLFVALTPMPTAVLESMNYPGTTSIFAFLTVFLEFIFLIFFLPRFGITGAAYALSLSALISVPLFLTVFFYRFRKYEKSLVL
jgi:O-antigen/teichoic acid export membrane protein